MASFGMSELRQIVKLAVEELDREDRYIAGSFARNPAYWATAKKRFPGIPHLDDEKYYQRVTARALLASFPLRVELEDQAEPGNNEHFDLVLYSGEKRVAVGELQRCMRATIERDAKPVQDDILKLKRLAPAGYSQFIVLFTLNPSDPRGTTDKWILSLREQLQLRQDLQHTRYIFHTEGYQRPNGPSSWEFGVMGFLL
ncbi:MAG TPA: hypothetical protein VGR97_00505 [Candidatus Acidoferrales bacterium]|nr:hypothetical protein [Candidatus Acidoferrales bacterium]